MKDPSFKDMMFTAANGLSFVFDVLEEIQEGEPPLRATRKAYKRALRRSRALVNAENNRSAHYAKPPLTHKRSPSTSPSAKKSSAESRTVPLFELCPCGCNLPKGQCMGRSAGGK